MKLAIKDIQRQIDETLVIAYAKDMK